MQDKKSVIQKFKDIRAFLFDVDGVFTDNKILITETGEYLRQMSTRDGYAVVRAIKKGYHVSIITGGNSQGVKKRLEKLGCHEIYAGSDKKVEKYEAWLEKYEYLPEETLYMGDDIIDSHVMVKVHIAAAPKDAVPEVKEIADYISPIKGGDGCVRDVIEKVMRSRGEW